MRTTAPTPSREIISLVSSSPIRPISTGSTSQASRSSSSVNLHAMSELHHQQESIDLDQPHPVNGGSNSSSSYHSSASTVLPRRYFPRPPSHRLSLSPEPPTSSFEEDVRAHREHPTPPRDIGEDLDLDDEQVPDYLQSAKNVPRSGASTDTIAATHQQQVKPIAKLPLKQLRYLPNDPAFPHEEATSGNESPDGPDAQKTAKKVGSGPSVISLLRKRAASEDDEECLPYTTRLGSRTMGGEIQLWVGLDHRLITIHKHVLCDPSNYFRSAVGERQVGCVYIDQEPPWLVQMAVHWMYTERLLISEEGLSAARKHSDTYPVKGLKLYVIAALCLFSEKYQIPRLQNLCMDCIVHECDTTALFHLSNSIWKKTSAESLLRKLIIRLLGCYCRAEDITLHSRLIGQDLRNDLLMATLDLRDRNVSKEQSYQALKDTWCVEFHIHSKRFRGSKRPSNTCEGLGYFEVEVS